MQDRSRHVTWSAQVGPMLNADSPDVLREAIKRAYVELLEKIGERTEGAAPATVGEPSAQAAAQPVRDPVTEPWPAIIVHGIIMFVPSSISMK